MCVQNQEHLLMLPSEEGMNRETKRFRKYVTVNAYQYTGNEPFIIHTLEGVMTAMPGDWIITGIHGETYPCKPEIFEESYEIVEA